MVTALREAAEGWQGLASQGTTIMNVTVHELADRWWLPMTGNSLPRPAGSFQCKAVATLPAVHPELLEDVEWTAP
jgi:hypothetical protein